VVDNGTAEALYSNPDLDAVPPFRLASDGIERMASWAAATCGMQLALPQQPVVEQLALEQAFVLPPPQQAAPSFAMPMMPMDQTELARRWLGLFSAPQPSPQLLRGLVAGTQQQQQQAAVLALPEVLPSPAQPQSPPVAQEAQPKPESAAATPALFDVVLMDMQMPVMDGLEATRRIRARNDGPRIPVLAMTANAMAADRDLCLQAGMDEVLTKPIEPDRLLEAVYRWLRRSRAEVTLPDIGLPTPRA
jgi:CheY-like chemotaxis protein